MRKRETVKEREREREKEREREREREKDEESMRIGRERKSPGKTDVPKLYAYNECEHSMKHMHTNQQTHNDIIISGMSGSIFIFFSLSVLNEGSKKKVCIIRCQ